MSKLVGRFPIFAGQARLGDLADTKGTVIGNTYPSFYLNNRLAYEKGFKELNVNSINGALNFITHKLSDMSTNGVPEFTLNLAYPKGAMVRFNGNVYISKSDDNTTHISQTSHWGKVKTEENCSNERKSIDDFPIGTILTVPHSTKREGYIDYVEGSEFNPSIYPELYQALGTNRFVVNTGSNNGDSLPIGSILHLLSANHNVPTGYVEWNNEYGVLRQYPELKNELSKMANRITDVRTKDMWLQSLGMDNLPNLEDFYFALGSNGSVGMFSEDTTRREELNSMPVVVDNSNSLNPLGITRCVAEERNYPTVTGADVSQLQLPSNVVVMGQDANQYNADVDKRGYKVIVGNGDVTKPRTLSTRVLIKATNGVPSATSSTHKRIIKVVN